MMLVIVMMLCSSWNLALVEHEIVCVSYSPDGQTIAIGRSDSHILIYDSKCNKIVNEINENSSEVSALAFSPDGKYLAYAVGSIIKLFDINKRIEIDEFKQSISHVVALRFSPDNKRLAVAHRDGTLTSIQHGNPEESKTKWLRKGLLVDMIYSPDGKFIVTASVKSISFWDSTTLEQIKDEIPQKTLGFGNMRVALFNDNNHIVVTERDNISIIELKSGKTVKSITSDIEKINCVKVGKDGSVFVSGKDEIDFYPPPIDREIHIVQNWMKSKGEIIQIDVAPRDRDIIVVSKHVKKFKDVIIIEEKAHEKNDDNIYIVPYDF